MTGEVFVFIRSGKGEGSAREFGGGKEVCRYWSG